MSFRTLSILLAAWPLFFGEAVAEGEKKMNFDLSAKKVVLNDGNTMPVLGLGTYSLTGDVCVKAVSAALQLGYRLIDTASIYHNENSIGKAVKNSGIPRDEIFITTKLYPHQYTDAASAIDEALERLGVDYIDLMLLHHPGKDDVEAYKAMEQAVRDGKIRSVGLSNYYIEELQNFLPHITIKPALVQNEIHPYYQDKEVTAYIQKQAIAIEGWYPLGGRGYTKEMLENTVLNEIGKKYGKTAAQVILRWNLQRNIIVIPGTGNPAHMAENMDIFDFELAEDDMDKINSLDRNEMHDWY